MNTIQFHLSLLPGALKGALRDGAEISLDYFRVLIPLTIGLKIIVEADCLPYLAIPLKPLTLLTGLPQDMGIAWAAGLLVNLYSALFVFVSLLPQLPDPPTVEQMTVFALMLLIAHSLPAEGRIASQCGISFWAATAVRCITAVFTGVLLHWFAMFTGMWSEPAVLLFNPPPVQPGLHNWILGEIGKLAGIFAIICAVMLLQRFLRYFHISLWLGNMMEPLLRRLGMGPAAATTVVVGFCMGLIYGSGIIIREAREGNLTSHEVFSAVMLISLSHALIEDTLLMGMIGASLWGTVAVRVLVSLFVGIGLNYFMKRLYSGSGRES